MRKLYQLNISCSSGVRIPFSASPTPAVGGGDIVTLTGVSEVSKRD